MSSNENSGQSKKLHRNHEHHNFFEVSASPCAYSSLPALPTHPLAISDKDCAWWKSNPTMNVVNGEDGVVNGLLKNNLVQREIKDAQNSGEYIDRPKKNLFVLSVGWVCFFMAFFSLRSLQSSMNHVEGLGLASLACIYAGFLLACLVVIPIVQTLGVRRTIILGLIFHIVYVTANVYPTFFTILPSSLLAGFSQACMWTAQGSYLVMLSKSESFNISKPLKSTASSFFGVFFLFFSMSPILGSLMTSLLMKNAIAVHISVVTTQNSTIEIFLSNASIESKEDIQFKDDSRPELWDRGHYSNISMLDASKKISNLIDSSSTIPSGVIGNVTDSLVAKKLKMESAEVSSNLSVAPRPDPRSCGIWFCHKQVVNDVIFVLPMNTRVIIIGAFDISLVLALVIFTLFLDENRLNSKRRNCSLLTTQIKELLSILTDVKFGLLMPLIFYMGFQTSFYSGEMTKAFVTCLFGMDMVGYSMACFGLSAGISSYVSGYLKRCVSRLLILFVGFVTNSVCLLVLGLWSPTEESIVGVFALVSLWGVADGIWMTHVNCVTGLLFPGRIEAAFTGFQLVIALGMVVGYSTSQHVCMIGKMVAVGVLATIGIVSFVFLQWRLKRKKHFQK